MTETEEQLIILLLGSADRPLSAVHLQKEMFVFSKTFPKVAEDFNFQKHYLGAYSQILQELAEEPYYFPDAYVTDEKGTHLTEKGKTIASKIIEDGASSANLKTALASFRMIRQLYDKLTDDEILFLMYATYPGYTELSSVYESLVKKKPQIIENLKSKGIITEDRYDELKAMKF